MKPSQASQLLGIAGSTIRAWTLGEFKLFFSPSAQGGDGRTRDMDEQDLQILHFINLLKQKGLQTDDIVATLNQSRARGWSDLPPLPDRPVNVASVPVVPAAAAGAQLDAERRSYLREISRLESEIEKLSDQLSDEQRARREDYERFLRELSDAKSQLAAVKNELDLWRSGRLKADDD